MKRITGIALLIVLAGVILLPVSFAVNNSSSNGTAIADGGASSIPPWPHPSLLPGAGLSV